MTGKWLLFIVKLVIVISLVQSKLILKQVVILNRHSLRAPLSKSLKDTSPKIWPEWYEKPGVLSAKGARLAGFMGTYFAAWLKKEQILPASCPSENELYVSANTKERTLTSAQSFIEKGFPDCNINVHHPGIDILNPLYNPIIHNCSVTFRKHALEDINGILNTDHLNEAYEIVSHILDYKRSKICEVDKKCNLAKDKNRIRITPGYKPKLSGPLKISNGVVDAFLMQYYEGFPIEDVAWGQLADANLWNKIIELSRAYFNVTYRTRLVAKDLSGPLVKFIAEIFLREDNQPKVTLLFGHDVNIHTVFKTLSVKPYTLDNQVELIPIGSAVVFQKWEDDEFDKEYFKLSFVYQSTEQLRDYHALSLETPPQIKTLELDNCKVDKEGFCSWDLFKTFLSEV